MFSNVGHYNVLVRDPVSNARLGFQSSYFWPRVRRLLPHYPTSIRSVHIKTSDLLATTVRTDHLCSCCLCQCLSYGAVLEGKLIYSVWRLLAQPIFNMVS